MRPSSSIRPVLGLLLFAATVSAWRLFPVPPSSDSFYKVPSLISLYPPGSIINYRDVPSAIGAFGVKTNLASAHQILYRTNDGDGKATATVLTVLIPPNADFGAVLSVVMAEDAVSIDCAPSYGMLLESEIFSRTNSATAQLQLLLIEAAMAQGWVVIVPDFEGPQASFLDSKLAGQATLDGIRAALKSGWFTGIRRDAALTLWGYSGGASAALVAASMRPTYASELDISGVALGGLSSPNLSLSIFAEINKGPHAGLIPMSLTAVGKADATFQASLDKHLLASAKNKFYLPRTQCLDANLASFNNVDVLGMFDCWDCVKTDLVTALSKHKEATYVPRSGSTFIYHCLHDELTPIAEIDKEVQEFCQEGAIVHYQRDLGPNVNHRNYGVLGAPHAIEWLRGIYNSSERETVCSNEAVTSVDLPDWFLDAYPSTIRNALVKLIAGDIGAG
ncbi:Lipase, secreted [Akanthomyces lecanii RCEF 1005]|uniref:Lipase, secreted n=1 Tax=Akanthomyces lecanii RCEF 1005 TaxID=1081108 RepID=A0A162KHR2_CORDF|nr:Lipase, secreted [Akanthomyces lecanii RCEF 1005]